MKTAVLFIIFTIFTTPIFGQWETYSFIEAGGIYYASSELEKPPNSMDIGKYSPKNLLDHSLRTSWVEGEKGSGIGSFVLIGTGKTLKKFIVIYNGYEQSENLFLKNNRVKQLKVTLSEGFTDETKANQFGFDADTRQYMEAKTILLKDKMGMQVFPMPFDSNKVKAFVEETHRDYPAGTKTDSDAETATLQRFLFIKYEIASVYKGSKWDDTCIAEIGFSNRGTGEIVPLGESIEKVYEDADSEHVIIETNKHTTVTLADAAGIARDLGYTGNGEFFTIMVWDAAVKEGWVILDYQHGFTDGGDIEETHHLWSLKYLEEVPPSLLNAYGITPQDILSFNDKNGRLYAVTDSGKNILLEDLALDMDTMNTALGFLPSTQ
ncbi:MAG: hypothetical protein J7L71_00540 [Spirochaetaceae bacterium]|nr:hypothetical protein [Spirochaetaceae bacterium]